MSCAVRLGGVGMLVIRDLAETIATTKVLKDLGVRISLEDFGSGCSSLAFLASLPLDEIKIDKSFAGNLQGSLSARIGISEILAEG